MINRFRSNDSSHIPYSPVEGLSDEQLREEIQSVKLASDVLPRKRALREERIARHISDIGIDRAEELLGIGIQEEVNNG